MAENSQAEKLRARLNLHSKMILNVFVILLWATSILMFIIILLGIAKISQATYQEFVTCHKVENVGIIKILEGLEFVFVSPLLYLLIQSITKYVFATKPEINPSLEVKRDFIKYSILEITNVKIYTAGLFISLLFLHSIKLILQESMVVEKIIYIISILVILITYYFILDIIAEKLRRKV